MRGHKELLWIIPYNFLHLLAPSHVHYVCDFCSSLAPAETCQLPQPHSLTVEILDLLIARCANFGTWLFFRVWRRRPRWTTLAVIRHVGHGREDHKNHLSPDSWDLFNSKKLGTIFSAKALKKLPPFKRSFSAFCCHFYTLPPFPARGAMYYPENLQVMSIQMAPFPQKPSCVAQKRREKWWWPDLEGAMIFRGAIRDDVIS